MSRVSETEKKRRISECSKLPRLTYMDMGIVWCRRCKYQVRIHSFVESLAKAEKLDEIEGA